MQAHVLIGSANVLWKRYTSRAFLGAAHGASFTGEPQPWPAMMLDGFAMENLLKALLLARGVPATQDGRLDQQLKTHNLTALCNRTNINRSVHEDELLERVRRMMELGRYPVGADATTDLALRLELPHDRNMMTGLLRRVDDEFKRARASVDDDITRLGVSVVAIPLNQRMRRIAMLHGTRLNGTPI